MRSFSTALTGIIQSGDPSLIPWVEGCTAPLKSNIDCVEPIIYGEDFEKYIDQGNGQKPGILCVRDNTCKGSVLNLVNRGIYTIIYRNSPLADDALRLALQHYATGKAPLYSDLHPSVLENKVVREITTPQKLTELLTLSESELAFQISNRCKRFVGLAIKEAVTNAFYHAFREPGSHDRKYNSESFSGLYDDDLVTVEHCNTDDWLSITVTDNNGSLGPLRVANSMDRHHTDRGLLDMRGRGFYLMHQISDRMIIRIERRVKTSVQMFFTIKENNAPRHFELLVS